jgi:hypothetical protein
MNDRIDELAKECYVITGSVYTDHFAYWKFAELIIQECIRLCDQVDIVGADECIDNIKEHFGVEE